MRSKSTKAKKQTGARKKVASKAAASKRKIPAGRVGTITVKMPRSMWALLIEVGEKVYTKAARRQQGSRGRVAESSDSGATRLPRVGRRLCEIRSLERVPWTCHRCPGEFGCS